MSPIESLNKVFERVGGNQKYIIDDDEDGTMEMEQIGAERTKNVLILMSDTGGGHRASAEAIRDAFQLEYGDQYRIIVKDVWKEYTGWPLNDMEGQYKFMVKHVQLWKVAFHGTSPKWIHSAYLAAIAAYYAKEVEAGLMEYKPDIIISVHPLMQHIPLWVLKWQGLQKKVIFVTVITDLNTCHRTWFHPSVNRLYCPSEEVAKRALLDGVDDSQIRIFGLPIRPSFCRAVLVKEKGNVPFVVENGAGVFTRSPKETARIVAEWFSSNTDERMRMSENALKLAQPNAVFDIVKDIHELACQRGPLFNVPYMLTSSFSSLIY
ncbi:monogalactosyldiacylglycerol synthase [Striga asiatica]|uniref:Monogalactosyldiacylglycerol synthase n=1 Tax=Striga asiatica TaxID=4170 RepID=A0A5A7PLZ1_STRAF|nr:monogalactosyldiacylglycerol synthase [Striga asiatica]